ncbi:PREDICTED: gamma-aminobutyric acid type B receptor subunit 2 isoform X2 [Nicrophorus vespilloides]|uniref:Gamma-aminobutyric acid type B receptor subunit 2 isoform X2 n=1 Tax=Nicrophorus vespilloides TaxID=110193 RepID=A0ABM1M7X2_NICVS|nr:PREDICTED: gamma-aminobutyric acid type B receptor subunit 2 isoform X2 [Nicrophorus vespilloides]
MWLFARHVRAFLVSVAVLTVILNLQDKNSSKKSHLTIGANESWGNDSSSEYGDDYDLFDEEETSEMLEDVKKQKYREFVLGGRSARGEDDSDLHVLGLFEMTTKHGIRDEGFAEVFAAQMAVDHINRKNLLSGHRIKLLINDTQCDPGAGIDRFFHALYSKKIIIMLLGSGCSNVTESLANIVPYWNILQVSFGSTSPSLSDRNKFPLFFRTVAPDSSHNDAKAAFIRKYKWDTVATFSQRENIYLFPINNLIINLEKSDVQCAKSITFSLSNFKERLKALKELNVRIIVGSFSAKIAPRIFCEIYKLKMFGIDYVWILQDRQATWWRDTKDCRHGHLREATEGVIFLEHHNMIPDNGVAISGLSNKQFDDAFNKSLHSRHARQTYDAIWAMALAMKAVSTRNDYNLTDFFYDDDKFIDEAVGYMQELRFMGVSGPVRFRGADRVGNSIITQIQGGVSKTVAIYYVDDGRLDFKCYGCNAIRWREGKVPIAKRVLRFKLVTIPKSAFYLVSIVSGMGILACILFLCFNYRYREQKVIKLSSPRLNNIAVSGCVLVYAAVILLGIDIRTVLRVSHFAKLCTMRVYLLSAGFSLAFGSIFAKTYRIQRIFTYSTSVRDKFLKDKQLISLIFVLLIIDAVIIALWVYTDPMQRHLHNLTMQISSDDRSVLYQPQVEVCKCNNTTGWFIAICVYKGFLLTMGVYTAWETRRIKVDALNDSQYIGISVYSTFFASLVVFVTHFLTDYILLSYIARTFSILTSTTITLLLLFVPKLKSVLFEDGEDKDQVMQSMGLKIECNTRRLRIDDPHEIAYRMEVQNKVYRCEIQALDKEIAILEGLLRRQSSSPNYPKVSRASWPSTHLQGIESMARRPFLSETTLLEEDDDNVITFLADRPRVLDKLRTFFSRRIPSWRSRFVNGLPPPPQPQPPPPIEVSKPFIIPINENPLHT